MGACPYALLVTVAYTVPCEPIFVYRFASHTRPNGQIEIASDGGYCGAGRLRRELRRYTGGAVVNV
jgi:hypothetical protein